jgi:YVTN family beta-propeller protein
MTTRSANKSEGLILTSALWMIRLFFVASALYGAHAEQHDPAKATTFGYVVNAVDNTVSVIDTASNAVVATIPVGTLPVGVATTPDGTRAYVTNAGDNTVSVIDTAKNTVMATIPVVGEPQSIAITPDGKHGYITNVFDNTVSVIDTAKNTVVAKIPVGDEPSGIAITPDANHSPEHDNGSRRPLAYVTNVLDNTVSVIDTASNTVVDTIPVGDVPDAGVAFTPDGSRAYVTNFDGNTVSVIDTARKKVVDTIPVGDSPGAIAITPDGTQAYVMNLEDSNASVIATAKNTVVATIPVDFGATGVAILADETYQPGHEDLRQPPLAYVTNNDDNIVLVIDTASNTVVATIPVGQNPLAIAFATVTPSHRNNEQ